VIAGCAVVALAMGAQATEAVAAKPSLWVLNFARERVTPPTQATVQVLVENACDAIQQGQLSTNGKPSDAMTFASAVAEECPRQKTAGGIKSIALKSAGGVSMTMTAKDDIHVLYAETWCVYTLPKTFTLPASGRSWSEANLTGALDKPASFGTCASTRAIQVLVRVEEAQSHEVFEAETVG
jgi:hypothetical protein